ncbi:dimethylamine monooxygenase subunit DmmA family protein [Rhodococcus sp. KBW08]|uniref:dimethylamine monooxygenase subunit DmmA family protein n=1 Tax=Rhodococcus sp. KBW08 TaxID=2144188 RepID=UPI000F59CCA2|nr:dimethylamine monooxygenase subunit DmmA family protein [Rhodococcus sp. KBW08]MDJ0105292.1 dimethylamine monooxygenase subunit DmmA family protein [Rhodococcus erythropolis]
MIAPVNGTADVLMPGFTMRPSSVPAAQTNLPRWTAPSMQTKTPGCTYLVYCADSAAVSWISSETCLSGEEIQVFEECAEQLNVVMLGDLDGARAGTRIVLCGPEKFVAVGASVARSYGALDAELVPLVLDVTEYGVVDETARDRRVYCGGCRSVSNAHTAVGDLVLCSGCGARVIVHYHYSRDMAAFLAQPLGRARPTGFNGFSAGKEGRA